MSIDFTGHCAYPIEEAQRRIVFLRRERPDWFDVVLHIADASDLGPFGCEIAREFGIEAKCKFGLFVWDKERLDDVREAVELVYRIFGTAHLVITYGNDSIRPPLQAYPGMPLD